MDAGQWDACICCSSAYVCHKLSRGQTTTLFIGAAWGWKSAFCFSFFFFMFLSDARRFANRSRETFVALYREGTAQLPSCGNLTARNLRTDTICRVTPTSTSKSLWLGFWSERQSLPSVKHRSLTGTTRGCTCLSICVPACMHAARSISEVCMSTNGKFSITASWDTTARLWSNDSGQHVRSFVGHTSMLYAACLSSDGRMLITGSNDKTARVRACHIEYFFR